MAERKFEIVYGEPISGQNLAFDQDGNLRLSPEIERVIEQRFNVRIGQFAAALTGALLQVPRSMVTLRPLVRELQRWAPAAFCNTCNGTGFDYVSHCPCPDCATLNSPTPEQAADAPGIWGDLYGYMRSPGASQALTPPRSRCCDADVFEERGRPICERCRVTCKVKS